MPNAARVRVHAAVADQPLDLGPREVGVEHEAGALANERLVAGGAQLVAAGGGAAVLPDQRTVQRGAGRAVPGDDGLALVGDSDAGERGAVDAGGIERLMADAAGDLPDLVRVVLDPARAREVLPELAVGTAGDPAVAVEEEGGRAGGALVQREDHERILGVGAAIAKVSNWSDRFYDIDATVTVCVTQRFRCVCRTRPAIAGLEPPADVRRTTCPMDFAISSADSSPIAKENGRWQRTCFHERPRS